MNTVLAILLSFATAKSMEPGLWHTETQFSLGIIALPEAKDDNCISKEQAGDVKKSIGDELKKKDCLITKWDIKAEKLKATIQCDNSDIKAKGDLNGTVGKKEYNLNGNANGTFKGIPVEALITMTGKWQKKCDPEK